MNVTNQTVPSNTQTRAKTPEIRALPHPHSGITVAAKDNRWSGNEGGRVGRVESDNPVHRANSRRKQPPQSRLHPAHPQHRCRLKKLQQLTHIPLHY